MYNNMKTASNKTFKGRLVGFVYFHVVCVEVKGLFIDGQCLPYIVHSTRFLFSYYILMDMEWI